MELKNTRSSREYGKKNSNAISAIENVKAGMRLSSYKAKTTGGKISCKYYKVCGNTENCSRCEGYQKL